MKIKNVLIVSDVENQHYWKASINKIKNKNSLVNIIIANDISKLKKNNLYDMVMVDISNIEDLYRLIPEIHHENPMSRILVVSSTPTWKQTREIIRLGAATLIRKSSNLDEFINEIDALKIDTIK